MVAVVTGAGLGLFNASNNVLGAGGVLGQALQGEDGSLAWVNAASGNLVLQDVDTSLSGVGVDLALLRTYNAQGTLTSATNGLGWSWDEERTVTLTTGTVNTSGSQVTRTTGDGASSVYTFNGTAYVSSAGDGAHDSLTYNATTHQWTWVEGSTRQVDVYGDSQNATTTGRLLSQTDESGNAITFQYDASGHLTDVTDLGSGQHVKLVYAGTPALLQEVDTFELQTDGNGRVLSPPVVGSTPSRRILYGYTTVAGVSRVQTVTTDLTPAVTSDSKVFVTTYGYDSAGRVTSVKQNDGSTSGGSAFQVSFTYDGSGRVATVTDANGKQTFTYNAGSTDITLSDAGGGHAQT